MSKLTELIDDVQEPIIDFAIKAFTLAKNKKSNIRSIIIQLNKGNIYIGRDTKGRYIAEYYDPTKSNQDKEFEDLVEKYKKSIEECKDCIDDAYPKNRMRSFNIFFDSSKRKINICKNLIGNTGMTKCRLFDEISL
jgi:hypothetical protein